MILFSAKRCTQGFIGGHGIWSESCRFGGIWKAFVILEKRRKQKCCAVMWQCEYVYLMGRHSHVFG